MALHHEHNMFKMGGLRQKMPVIFWTFLIGSASLAALPLVTAGFYSKDQILWFALAGQRGSPLLYAAGLVGAFITAVYTFRMVFLTFFGTVKTHVSHVPGRWMSLPLVILAVLSLIGGFIELPHTLGHVTLFSDFLAPVLPKIASLAGMDSREGFFQLLAGVVALSGVYVAYLFYIWKPQLVESLAQSPTAMGVHRFWFSGWGFDKLYNTVLVRPFVYLASVNKNDVVDSFYTLLTRFTQVLHQRIAQTQNGILRWYMMGIVLGAVLIVTLSLLQ